MNLLVFDSGIGGLGVARQIRALQPAARLIYLADNACFPYGEQPDDFLIGHIIALLGGAIERITPGAVVIACNTASTIALAALRAAYKIPFIGCVPPVKPAAAASRTRHVGLLATPATIRRPYLQQLIGDHAAGCTVHSLATPSLAGLAERKFAGERISLAALAGAVAPLFATPGARLIDCIALGCTHYGFLLPELQRLYPEVSFFDPAPAVARQVYTVTNNLRAAPAKHADTAFFTAPVPDRAGMERRLAAFGFSRIEMLSLGGAWL